MNRIRVLHVIEQLRPGGPLQALISAKKRSDPKLGIEHHIASIRPADRRASAAAALAGISGISAPNPQSLRELIAASDIVQVHFWNSPDIHEFLGNSQLPPMRLLLWCHVNGTAPHVIPRSLLRLSDLAVLTSKDSLNRLASGVRVGERVILVQSVADFSRIRGRPLAHAGFHIGYMGRVHFAKLHQSFVGMSAAVEVSSARFLICGDGVAGNDLKRQASALGILNRFEFHDYLEDVSSFLATLDVFGYPLTADNYSTAELSLQEAMYFGVPPVVFPHGGPGEIVKNGYTGLVVDRPEDYSAAIGWLYRHPEQRKRLGKLAASAMRDRERLCSQQPDLAYQRAMEKPKRLRGNMDAAVSSREDRSEHHGAAAFVRSLDRHGDVDFKISMTAADELDAHAAEQRIALMSPVWRDVILQYRVRNPNDPYLRLWAGLVLRASGRRAVAAAEFRASIALGCNLPRLRRYYIDSMESNLSYSP